jgi:hypothetical protein
MNRGLHAVRLRLKPVTLHLGDGDSVKLSKMVGKGKDKYVYKILGQEQVVKVIRQKNRGSCILREAQHEKILRDYGIESAPYLRYDPKGNWIIKEYVRDPTVRDLIKSRSELIFSEALVSALFALNERLCRAKIWMDMNPANWVLKFSGDTSYLLSLEPIIEEDRFLPFPGLFLPLWIREFKNFRMSTKRHRELKTAWEREDRFVFWRKYFGKKFPTLHFWRLT